MDAIVGRHLNFLMITSPGVSSGNEKEILARGPVRYLPTKDSPIECHLSFRQTTWMSNTIPEIESQILDGHVIKVYSQLCFIDGAEWRSFRPKKVTT